MHDGTNWHQVFNTQIGFRLVEIGGEFLLGHPRSQWMYVFKAQGQLARIEDGRGNTNFLTYGSGLQSDTADGATRSSGIMEKGRTALDGTFYDEISAFNT